MLSKAWGGSRVMSMVLTGVVAVGLSACGGGEGGEGCEHNCSNTGAGITTPVVITASLSLATPGYTLTAAPLQGFTLQTLSPVAVNWSGTPANSVQCVKLSNGVNGPFMAAQLSAVPASTFNFVPQIMPAVIGTYTGNVTLQAYSDTGCLLAISGASLTVPYAITVQ